MDLTTFLIQTLNGVQYGFLLFLVASGLTLIFGVPVKFGESSRNSSWLAGLVASFSIAEGTRFSVSKIPTSWSSRGSGTSITPTFGSIVQKG